METENEEESAFRVTMADGLRPLMKANFLLGISSFTIDSSGHIHHPRKIFNRFRVVIILFLIIYSSSITLYRLMDTLLWNPLYASQEFARFNRIVELTCQFISNIFPTMLICVGLSKSCEITGFFQEMGVYNADICEFADPKSVCTVTRRLFMMHLALMVIMLSVMQLRVFTSADPMEVEWWDRLMRMGLEFWVVMAMGVVLTTLLMFLKLFPIAYLECHNVALATCFTRVISNLGKFILEQADSWENRYLGYGQFKGHGYSRDKGTLSERLVGTEPASFSSKNKSTVPQSSKLEKSHGDDNHTPLTFSPVDSYYSNSSALYRKENDAVSQMTPGQQVCHVIRKLQSVAQMQAVTNRLFGSILALDIGFTAFMMILLKYLLIRNMGSQVARLRNVYLANATSVQVMQINDYKSVISSLFNSSLPGGAAAAAEVNPYQEDLLYIISPYGWLFFLTFDICFSLRLIILTKCLGNVHSASVHINGVLSKVLGKAQRLVDLINTTRSNNSAYYEEDDPELLKNDNDQRILNKSLRTEKSSIISGSRPLITSVEANTVLAFLTVNSSQPIAFSAVGLLTFSGSTIMLIASVVISYVVFLLQA